MMKSPQLKSEVQITRRYYGPSEKLWQAIAEGYLLIYTGAVLEKSRIDFRTAGKIHLEWKDEPNVTMDGEFLEIIPRNKVSFSWNTSNGIQSSVIVEMKESADYCELTLTHTFPLGTETKEYDFGWDDALFDLKKHVYR